MKPYIGTKIVHAEPVTNEKGDGYIVVYKDGYKSWSPKEAFEEAYVALEDIPNRLTLDDLKAKIVGDSFARIAGTTTMMCHLQLENGFVVVGTSACIDPAQFDEAVGMEVARDNAIEEIWKLEGYLLRERRYQAGLA